MMILGWIVFGVWFFYLASRYDKKMNENFINMSIRSDALEEKINFLEYCNSDKDKTIKYLEDKVRDLEDRLIDLEKPYRNSDFDDF